MIDLMVAFSLSVFLAFVLSLPVDNTPQIVYEVQVRLVGSYFSTIITWTANHLVGVLALWTCVNKEISIFVMLANR